MTVLEVRDLGKAYCTYSSEFRRISSWFGFSPGEVSKHWVLRDVSFTLRKGESLAIIGQNGAGKSTLLKLITGILKPSEGSVSVHGRIAAILELGLGFNADLTGFQNVVHSLGLWGYSQDQIHSALPEVKAFSEIGEYFEQPVRTYSSGMQARLAFAVATAFRPNILIVDEALAVGDAAFQRKCFQRIENFRAAGASLLFVSHDVDAVKRLCSKALYLSHGNIVAFGRAKQVCDLYEQMLSERHSNARVSGKKKFSNSNGEKASAGVSEHQYGDKGATIYAVQIEDEFGNSVDILEEALPFRVAFLVEFHTDCIGVEFGMMLKTVDGVPVYGTNTILSDTRKAFTESQVARVVFNLQGNLVSGVYYLNVGVTHQTTGKTTHLHRRVDCMSLRVSSSGAQELIGYANLFASKTVELLPEITSRAFGDFL